MSDEITALTEDVIDIEIRLRDIKGQLPDIRRRLFKLEEIAKENESKHRIHLHSIFISINTNIKYHILGAWWITPGRYCYLTKVNGGRSPYAGKATKIMDGWDITEDELKDMMMDHLDWFKEVV